MLGILPVEGSDDWKYSLSKEYPELENFPDDKPVFGLNLGGFWLHEKWTTISAKFAKEELMPFFVRRLRTKSNRIKFHGYADCFHESDASWHLKEECARIAEVVFEALNTANCTFETMEIGYYGPFSEEFICRQIDAGISSLELVGPWPNGAINLLKMHLERCDEPMITLTSHNKVSVNQEFFDSIFAKFLEHKLYLKFMHGTQEFGQDYLKTLRTDLQVKLDKDEGKNMLTWKSPIDCRDFFQVEFLENEVRIFTHNMGQCRCKNKRKLPCEVKDC